MLSRTYQRVKFDTSIPAALEGLVTADTPAIYVIEGTDGTGKSTIASGITQLLQRRVRFGYAQEVDYFHFKEPVQGDYQLSHEMFVTILDAIYKWRAYERRTVIDRFHMSTAVYGKVLNRGLIAEESSYKLSKLLASNLIKSVPVQKILMTRSRVGIAQTLADRGELDSLKLVMDVRRHFDMYTRNDPSWLRLSLDDGINAALKKVFIQADQI